MELRQVRFTISWSVFIPLSIQLPEISLPKLTVLYSDWFKLCWEQKIGSWSHKMTMLSSKTETEAKQTFRRAWRLRKGEKKSRLYNTRNDRSGKGVLLKTSCKIQDKETREEFWKVGKGGSGGGKCEGKVKMCELWEHEQAEQWVMQTGGMEFAQTKEPRKCAAVRDFCSPEKHPFFFSHSLFQHKEVFKNINQKRIKKRSV